MANKTFGDLPARSTILADDFFITNRTSDVNFPEGRTGIDILKNYLYPGLIIKNTKLVGSKEFEAKISSQRLEIKNGNNLVTFQDPKKSVHGLFEIKGTQTKGTGINVCTFSLTYIPNDKEKLGQKYFYSNEVLEIDSGGTSLFRPLHLFIDPFVPGGKGSFMIDISFIETKDPKDPEDIASIEKNTVKKCKIDASFLLFETF